MLIDYIKESRKLRGILESISKVDSLIIGFHILL
jgi:hypothetical protein